MRKLRPRRWSDPSPKIKEPICKRDLSGPQVTFCYILLQSSNHEYGTTEWEVQDSRKYLRVCVCVCQLDSLLRILWFFVCFWLLFFVSLLRQDTCPPSMSVCICVCVCTLHLLPLILPPHVCVCIPDWPQTHGTTALAFQVLVMLMCTTTSGLLLFVFSVPRVQSEASSWLCGLSSLLVFPQHLS